MDEVKLSYVAPDPVQEVGRRKQTIKTSRSVTYDEATLKDIEYEIQALQNSGYVVEVALKVKVPKEPKE